MTKTEYMEVLKEKLERFSSELQEEILEDYRQHFAEGEAEGKSDEEMIEELGDIEDMISELPEELCTSYGAGGNAEGTGESVVGGNAVIGRGQVPALIPSEREQSFVYEGDYKAAVLDGKVANMLIEQSKDNHIYIEYKDNSEERQYAYYQYEENGCFYAGFRRIDSVQIVKAGVQGFIGKVFQVLNHVYQESSIGQDIMLTVKLPESVLNLTVKNGSGRIELKGIATDNLNAGGGSGRMTITDVQVKNAKCGTGSGRIKLQNVRAEVLNCGTGSGRIEGNEVKADTFKCGTGSGHIQMHTEVKTLNMDTGSGRIEAYCQGPVQNASFATGSGSVKVYLRDLTGLQAKLSTGSGDAHVDWKGERHNCKNKRVSFGDESTVIKASTGSGGVEIVVE